MGEFGTASITIQVGTFERNTDTETGCGAPEGKYVAQKKRADGLPARLGLDEKIA